MKSPVLTQQEIDMCRKAFNSFDNDGQMCTDVLNVEWMLSQLHCQLSDGLQGVALLMSRSSRLSWKLLGSTAQM